MQENASRVPNSIGASPITAQAHLVPANLRVSEGSELLTETLGTGHPNTLRAKLNLARVYSRNGNHDDAEALYHEALVRYQDYYGTTPNVGKLLSEWANARLRAGNPAGAESLSREALELLSAELPGDHPSVYGARLVLADILAQMNRHNEAETILLETYADVASGADTASPAERSVISRLARFYASWCSAASTGERCAFAEQWRQHDDALRQRAAGR